MFNIKGKRIRKNIEAKFSKRKKSDWLNSWKLLGYNEELIKHYCQSINKFMEYSNYHFFPSDRMKDILYNPYSDLREVEALIWLEDELNISSDEYDLQDSLEEFLKKKQRSPRISE